MAGSGWDETIANREGYFTGVLTRPIGVVRKFTSDDTDATVPAMPEVSGISGMISSIDIEFSAGGTAPTSVQVLLKTSTGTLLETSAVLTASGRFKFDQPQEIVDGFSASVVCVGNAKIATLVFNVW